MIEVGSRVITREGINKKMTIRSKGVVTSILPKNHLRSDTLVEVRHTQEDCGDFVPAHTNLFLLSDLEELPSV